MDDPKIIAAIISAFMAISITIVSQLLIGRREKRIAREEERKKVQLEYLNSLRFIEVLRKENAGPIANPCERQSTSNSNCFLFLFIFIKICGD